MSASVTVDRGALLQLLFEVDTLARVEALRHGRDGVYENHIFMLPQRFKRAIDPREDFDEGITDAEADSVGECRAIHARRLFRSLVIEDMLSHA